MRNPRGHEDVLTWNPCPPLRPCPRHLKFPDSTSWTHAVLFSKSVLSQDEARRQLGGGGNGREWMEHSSTVCILSLLMIENHKLASHSGRALMTQETENSKFELSLPGVFEDIIVKVERKKHFI